MKLSLAFVLFVISLSAFATGSGQQASTDMQDKDCAGVANSGDRRPADKTTQQPQDTPSRPSSATER